MDDASQTSTTLLRQVASGDKAAESRFYERYSRLARVVSLAMGIHSQDCDDVIQEVMGVAMNALSEGRYERDRAGFRAWLRGIVRNKVLKTRESMARAPRPAATMPDRADPAPDPAAAFEAVFDAEMLAVAQEEALEEIKAEVEPETWQAFDLVKLKGWRPKDTAQHLGLSRGAVDLAIHRIKKRLEEKLAHITR